MAQSTLTPDSREEQDAYGDPQQKRLNLSEAEKQELHAIHVADQKEAAALDPINPVRAGEQSAGDPANPMNFQNIGKRQRNRAGTGAGAMPGNPLTAIGTMKRAGPIGLIISIILGVSALLFGSYTLVPIHIYENLLSKYDTGTTTYTVRSNNMIAKKLTRQATEGNCDFAKILCRFTRPSNYMLDQMEKNGITPLDKNGQKITRNGLWPNTRPAQYSYTNAETNKTITFDATQTRTAMKDSDLQAAFHEAFKTRLAVTSDEVAKFFFKKYGAVKSDTTAKATTEDEVDKTIAGETNGTINEEGGTGETLDTSQNAIEEKISGEVTDEGNDLAKSSFGNTTGLVAGGVCLLGDAPGLITRTARAYQMAQLVRFGMLFMTTVGALKAGDATQQEVSALGTALTAVYLGKTAMDSYGMRYSLYGDLSPGSDKNYKNYVPGGAVSRVFNKITPILSSPIKKAVCQGATSPITGGFIDAVLGPGTFGLGDVINIGGGVLLSAGIMAAATYLIPLALKAVPASVYADLGEAAFGDITKGVFMTSDPSVAGSGSWMGQLGSAANPSAGQAPTAAMGGENYGDALASGIANSLGQLANTGGNAPLSVSDAVAYDQQTKAVNLAYAKEDQAKLSPLDASSPNTMMGALFEKIMPIYSQLGSLSGILSSLGGIASTSTASIFTGSAYAADDSAQYKNQCDDPSITNETGDTVAAGPFCNIQYGIPTQYLDMDPEQIASDLQAGGQIDKNSGEPVEDAGLYTATSTIAGALGIPTGTQIASYSDWLRMCTDGSTDQAVNCQIKDKQTAEYALYTIDHRVQEDLDNQQTDPSQSANSGTATIVSGTKQELAKEMLDSGKLQFIGDGNNYSAAQEKKIFSDIATGNTDGNSKPCGLNIKILEVIKEVVDKHSSVGISDSNSRCVGYNSGRSAGSRHWDGNGSAVDFYMLDGTDLNGSNAKSIELLKEIDPMLDKGTSLHNQSQVEQLKCRQDAGDPIDLGAVIQFGANCSHVHIDFPPWDDPNLQYYNGAY